MANEITISASLVASKGGASISSGTLSKQIDMTGIDMETATQAVGTSNEQLAIHADIATPLDILIKNLDATNYVEIFRDNADAQLIAKLTPGAFCFCPGINVKPYAKANTASCQLQFWACEV
jgi:hypothetical protein